VEFALVAVPLFVTLFGIFDLGRYAITMYSLRTLASATTRQVVINCYASKVSQNKSPNTCTTDPLSTTEKQQIAPALYWGGSPSVSISAGGSALTVQVSAPSFSMMMPFWGSALNAPSASAQLPF
jgi:Flp pilus assembly protein TadG